MTMWQLCSEVIVTHPHSLASVMDLKSWQFIKKFLFVWSLEKKEKKGVRVKLSVELLKSEFKVEKGM